MEIDKTTSVNQTQSVKSTKLTHCKWVKKVDYTDYSVDDLLNILFEEAKVNQKSIVKRYKELSDSGYVNVRQASKLLDLRSALNFSGNISVDKAYYETLQNTPAGKTGLLSLEFQMNFQGFAQNGEIIPTFNLLLNKKQFFSIDFDAFLNSAIASFNKNLIKAKSSNAGNSVQNQYQGLIDFYKTFQENFDKVTK